MHGKRFLGGTRCRSRDPRAVGGGRRPQLVPPNTCSVRCDRIIWGESLRREDWPERSACSRSQTCGRSGSTFILFVMAARALSDDALGSLALAMAAVQILVYLSDLGLTSLMMREIARTETLDALKWNLGRRTVIIVIAALPVLMFSAGIERLDRAILIFLVGIANNWYSALIAAMFALARTRRVIWTQFANGLCFILLGLGVGLLRPSVEGFLAVILLSYAILIGSSPGLVRRVWSATAVAPSLKGHLL